MRSLGLGALCVRPPSFSALTWRCAGMFDSFRGLPFLATQAAPGCSPATVHTPPPANYLSSVLSVLAQPMRPSKISRSLSSTTPSSSCSLLLLLLLPLLPPPHHGCCWAVLAAAVAAAAVLPLLLPLRPLLPLLWLLLLLLLLPPPRPRRIDQRGITWDDTGQPKKFKMKTLPTSRMRGRSDRLKSGAPLGESPPETRAAGRGGLQVVQAAREGLFCRGLID